MNNNNNNNLEITARILQELAALRQDLATVKLGVTGLNSKIDNLSNQFARQFIPINSNDNTETNGNEVNRSGQMLMENPDTRRRLTMAPNYRGCREIGKNPLHQRRPTSKERYNGMLLKLHQFQHGSHSHLREPKLKEQRWKLHSAAIGLLPTLRLITPNITKWSNLDEQDKLYFSLLLEEKVWEEHGLELFRCKEQWGARSLFAEAFKAYRNQQRRLEIAASRAVDSIQMDEERGDNQFFAAINGELDDDTESTTSNIFEE